MARNLARELELAGSSELEATPSDERSTFARRTVPRRLPGSSPAKPHGVNPGSSRQPPSAQHSKPRTEPATSVGRRIPQNVPTDAAVAAKVTTGVQDLLRKSGVGGTIWEQAHMRLVDAFRVFDKNGDGVISAAELRHALHSMEMGWSDDDISAIILVADKDRNGVLSYKEFVKQFGGAYNRSSPEDLTKFKSITSDLLAKTLQPASGNLRASTRTPSLAEHGHRRPAGGNLVNPTSGNHIDITNPDVANANEIASPGGGSPGHTVVYTVGGHTIVHTMGEEEDTEIVLRRQGRPT